MKHIFLSSSLILATSLSAQTTALDFTANDCAGMSHSLFSELEAGNVVILEMVMMGCQPCVTAANSLTTIVLPNVSDESRVKLYSIGFTNNITCTQMNAWKTANNFTHTVFAGMSAQTTHYGGMGMPTVAVVGAADHTVFYSEVGHSASDNPDILAAIEAALAASVGIPEVAAANELVVYPNPVESMIQLSGAYTSGQVIDAQGRIVLERSVAGNKTFDANSLPAGAYTLRLIGTDKAISQGRFVKL